MISSLGLPGELGLALIANFGIKTTANVVRSLSLRFPWPPESSASASDERSMQVYLINLDGDHERLAHFQRQARQAGIEFERLAAVDGRKLAPKDYQKLISPKFEFAPMTPAEFGLLGSHRKRQGRASGTYRIGPWIHLCQRFPSAVGLQVQRLM